MTLLRCKVSHWNDIYSPDVERDLFDFEKARWSRVVVTHNASVYCNNYINLQGQMGVWRRRESRH